MKMVTSTFYLLLACIGSMQPAFGSDLQRQMSPVFRYRSSRSYGGYYPYSNNPGYYANGELGSVQNNSDGLGQTLGQEGGRTLELAGSERRKRGHGCKEIVKKHICESCVNAAQAETAASKQGPNDLNLLMYSSVGLNFYTSDKCSIKNPVKTWDCNRDKTAWKYKCLPIGECKGEFKKPSGQFSRELVAQCNTNKDCMTKFAKHICLDCDKADDAVNALQGSTASDLLMYSSNGLAFSKSGDKCSIVNQVKTWDCKGDNIKKMYICLPIGKCKGKFEYPSGQHIAAELDAQCKINKDCIAKVKRHVCIDCERESQARDSANNIRGWDPRVSVTTMYSSLGLQFNKDSLGNEVMCSIKDYVKTWEVYWDRNQNKFTRAVKLGVCRGKFKYPSGHHIEQETDREDCKEEING